MANEGGDIVKTKDSIKQDFLEIPVTGFIFRIVEGIDKLRQAQIDDLTQCAVYEFENKDRFTLTPTKQIDTAEKLMKSLSMTQIQLFIYLLYRWRMQGGNAIFQIELKDYNLYKGIKVRNDSRKRFERDLEVLSSLSVQIVLKNNKGYIYGTLLNYQKIDANYYEIHFGSWIDYLKTSQYTLLHKQFFQFNPRYHRDALLLLLKISQLYKLQLRKANLQPNLKMYTLCKLLGISTEQIKQQGFKCLLRRLQNITKRLEQNCGFIIRLKVKTDNLTQFYDSQIYYDHPQLMEHYQQLERRSH